MGLMDKSLRLERQFTANNPRMIKALMRLFEDQKHEVLDGIRIEMTEENYLKLLNEGYYKEIPRKRNERRIFEEE